jgi:hypothetical protein
MTVKNITLILKVQNLAGRTVSVVQELEVIDSSQKRQLVDFLQRTVAEAYDRAIRSRENDSA